MIHKQWKITQIDLYDWAAFKNIWINEHNGLSNCQYDTNFEQNMFIWTVKRIYIASITRWVLNTTKVSYTHRVKGSREIDRRRSVK